MADVWNGCKRIFYITLFGILLIITAYLFYSSLDTLTYADVLGQHLIGKRTNLFLLGTSALLLSLILIFLKSIHTWADTYKRQISLTLFAVMITIQILLILNVRTSFRGDLLKVFDTAVSLTEGSGILANTHFSDYFMKYPNNIPLCLFTYGWLLFAKLIGIPYIYWMDFMKFINILFMNLGLLCSFSLICRYRSPWTGLCFLFLTFINPLWYLLGLMYYTSTISLAFSMGGIWLFERARRSESRWKKYFEYFATGIVLMAGYKIRATVILTVVSILIYCVLQMKKMKVSDIIIPALAVFLGAFLLLGSYGRIEQHYAGFEPKETGYPVIHWVMMSMQGVGEWNGIDDAYTGSFASKEERITADMERLKERVSDLNWGGVFTLLKNIFGE